MVTDQLLLIKLFSETSMLSFKKLSLFYLNILFYFIWIFYFHEILKQKYDFIRVQIGSAFFTKFIDEW